MGYLPTGAATGGGGSLRGKSAAAATLSMATNAAVAVMMIFIMLIPLCLDTRTSDRVTPQFAPLATAVELFFTAAHSSSFAEYDAARYNILNEGLRSHPGEIQSRGYHGQSQGAYGSTSPTRERFLTARSAGCDKRRGRSAIVGRGLSHSLDHSFGQGPRLAGGLYSKRHRRLHTF